MHICQVIASRGEGGLEKHVVDLSNCLADYCRVTVVGHAAYRSRLSDRVSLEPIDLGGVRWNPFTRRRLRAAFARLRPDIIHAHANKAAALVASALPRRSREHNARPALVATVHGLKNDTGMFDAFDRVIAVSQGIAGRVTNPAVEVIYNGLPPSLRPANTGRAYLSQSLPPPARALTEGRFADRPVVVTAGRLVPVKGFDVLLEAWRSVDATLFIAGDGKDRAQLGRLIGHFALGDRAALLGHRTDVPALMASCDLVVISSRREGFPYVLIEALHARVPLVSTRVPGASEILPEPFLCATEDAAALAACVNAALADLPATRAAFEPTWAFAAANLTVEAMADRTLKVYESALEAGTPT
jgi:glycosyltransferase involved in cell wall biosynthesis